MNLAQAGVTALRFVKRNSPFLLSAVAGIGLIALYVLTIKETEEAQEVIQEADEEEIHSFKMAKKVAKIYAPSFLCLVVTLVCIISSAVISHHMIRDLTMYAAGLSATFTQYRQKVINQNGVNADREIMTDITKECVPEDPLDYYEDDEDGILCLINGYGHYFRVKNVASIYSAFLALNKRIEMWDQEWIYLSDFWKEARVIDPLDHSYLGYGWTSYDLQRDPAYKASFLYPNVYKETEESGTEWYLIDLPAPMPLESMI